MDALEHVELLVEERFDQGVGVPNEHFEGHTYHVVQRVREASSDDGDLPWDARQAQTTRALT
jgi:hypothetical protein